MVSRQLVCSASLDENTAKYLTRPKNDQTSVADLGTGHFVMLSILDRSALMPFADIMCPKNCNVVQNRSVFFGQQ